MQQDRFSLEGPPGINPGADDTPPEATPPQAGQPSRARFGFPALVGALAVGAIIGSTAAAFGAVAGQANSTPEATQAAPARSNPDPQDTAPQIPTPAGAAGWGEPLVWGTPAAVAAVDAGDPAVVNIAIVEDLTCPFCATLHTTTKESTTAAVEGGRVVVKRYLVGLFGEGSVRAAEAAACAADQNHLEPFLDATYRNQQADHAGLTTDQAISIASQEPVNIPNLEQFTTCVTERTFQPYIESINQIAQQAGIQGTPTVFTNREQLPPTVNPTDPSVWERILDGASASELGPQALG